MNNLKTLTYQIVFILTFGLAVGGSGPSYSATRIWYEDCETTEYTTHFLENQFGSNYESYWNEFVNEVSQSTIAHSGSYSLSYNPILTGNPYAQTGIGEANFGNLGQFNLSEHEGRYWFFRWYARFEDSTYSTIGVKLLYIGCYGDYFVLTKSGNSSGIIVISDEPGGNGLYTHNGGLYSPGLDDEEWHKFEVYIDFGTGNSNGETWIRIDDTEVRSLAELDFVAPAAPLGCVAWPSNTPPGNSGSQLTWYDDMEIYLLTGPDDIPPDPNASDIPQPPQGFQNEG